MAMLSEHDLLDSIFQAALKGCGADVKNHKNAIWNACLALMGDVLRTSDEFTRERLLHRIEAELREGVVELNELLRPTPRNPFKLN
jgi:hypothetical protein